jgi:putative thiamine transport system permease protein
LPIYAVLAFSLSVVDMALILAPATPPPLAVLVFRWFADPDLSLRFAAAAGALLQLAVVIGAIGLWRAGEELVGARGRRWLGRGGRGGPGIAARRLWGGLLIGLQIVSGLSLLALALWSVTRRWRYPDALPTDWTLATWQRHGAALLWSGTTTLTVGLAAALLALALALACLENEQRNGLSAGGRALWLLYLPLLVPQVSFLFGVQVLAVRLGIDATWWAVVWSHLLFVLPYVFLALGDHFRALDPRYAQTAAGLGAGPGRVFWRIKLPILLRPVLIAAAVGFAVSVAQYLPTLFAGAGRLATLTTEAVSLATGGDRRVLGIYALAQTLLPWLAFTAAVAVPAWRYRRRRSLQVAQ